MDQEKIGKLIAKLRKAKGLTQSQLGDLVGVGFRSVSKWENGKTMPDISIINELSRILGVSADELLQGEQREIGSNVSITPIVEEVSPPKSKKKKLIYLLIPIVLIGIVLLIASKLKGNKLYTYNLVSNTDEYYIDGKVTVKDKRMMVHIYHLNFTDVEFSKNIIINYEYELRLNDTFLFGQGYIEEYELLESSKNINEFSDIFKINYTYPIDVNAKSLAKKKLRLTIKFLTHDGSIINKNIDMILKSQ